mmetsp:Transcript_1970/g.5641  ORF Transcript_1970/g.5641 Transcript_1970/m.5641 type:complete len:365 (+) Transcript_1970:447-1541(+)
MPLAGCGLHAVAVQRRVPDAYRPGAGRGRPFFDEGPPASGRRERERRGSLPRGAEDLAGALRGRRREHWHLVERWRVHRGTLWRGPGRHLGVPGRHPAGVRRPVQVTHRGRRKVRRHVPPGACFGRPRGVPREHGHESGPVARDLYAAIQRRVHLAHHRARLRRRGAGAVAPARDGGAGVLARCLRRAAGSDGRGLLGLAHARRRRQRGRPEQRQRHAAERDHGPQASWRGTAGVLAQEALRRWWLEVCVPSVPCDTGAERAAEADASGGQREQVQVEAQHSSGGAPLLPVEPPAGRGAGEEVQLGVQGHHPGRGRPRRHRGADAYKVRAGLRHQDCRREHGQRLPFRHRRAVHPWHLRQVQQQ